MTDRSEQVETEYVAELAEDAQRQEGDLQRRKKEEELLPDDINLSKPEGEGNPPSDGYIRELGRAVGVPPERVEQDLKKRQ